MPVNAYINCNGNCREAVEFYAKVFGTGIPQIMTYGEAPPDPEYTLPEEAKSRVLYTQLNISGSTVMFSDIFPGMAFVAGNNMGLAFVSRNPDEIKSCFNQLKEGGMVSIDLQETFWSKCYGKVTDKFGIEWQLSYENEEMK